jgi:hypothetical protein
MSEAMGLGQALTIAFLQMALELVSFAAKTLIVSAVGYFLLRKTKVL